MSIWPCRRSIYASTVAISSLVRSISLCSAARVASTSLACLVSSAIFSLTAAFSSSKLDSLSCNSSASSAAPANAMPDASMDASNATTRIPAMIHEISRVVLFFIIMVFAPLFLPMGQTFINLRMLVTEPPMPNSTPAPKYTASTSHCNSLNGMMWKYGITPLATLVSSVYSPHSAR